MVEGIFALKNVTVIFGMIVGSTAWFASKMHSNNTFGVKEYIYNKVYEAKTGEKLSDTLLSSKDELEDLLKRITKLRSGDSLKGENAAIFQAILKQMDMVMYHLEENSMNSDAELVEGEISIN